jgi:large subunit ribosomal protein L1
MARSNRYKEAAALIDPKKTYAADEAVALAKKTSNTKFDGSVEVHVRLGIDPKKSDQQVRGTVSLPHGTGKTKKVAAFVGADKEAEAKEAGADVIGDEAYIEELARSGKIDFDVAVASPDMMPKLAKAAKVLGPRGLMPNPKSGTVGPNVKKMVSDLKKGMIAFRSDDGGIVHTVIGKASFDESKLKENFDALMEALRRAKPGSSKGVYLKSVTMTTSMGPGIRVAV